MSTASITHRPVPMVAAAVAVVGVLALGAVLVAQNDSGGTPAPSTTSQNMPDPGTHWQRPLHSGVQPGE